MALTKEIIEIPGGRNYYEMGVWDERWSFRVRVKTTKMGKDHRVKRRGLKVRVRRKE